MENEQQNLTTTYTHTVTKVVATEPEQLYMHPNNNAWECAERIKWQQQQRHTHTLQSGQKLFKRMRENQNAFMQTNKKKNAATAPNNPANSMAWRRQRRRIGKQTASEKIK